MSPVTPKVAQIPLVRVKVDRRKPTHWRPKREKQFLKGNTLARQDDVLADLLASPTVVRRSEEFGEILKALRRSFRETLNPSVGSNDYDSLPPKVRVKAGCAVEGRV